MLSDCDYGLGDSQTVKPRHHPSHYCCGPDLV